MSDRGKIHTHLGADTVRIGNSDSADPIVTEIVRNSLNSAANQMKKGMVRCSFSPIIYEVLDFAVALYDSEIRMMAQAPSIPVFMGTMSFCVDEAVKSVGGPEHLDPGDVLLFNIPYHTGSHTQDVAVVMPIFCKAEIVGYAAIKAHWVDIGAKEPYSTDTVDIFQEGTMFPGVKVVRKGELDNDIYRIITANSRVPKTVGGDFHAQLVGVRIGSREVIRIIDRVGIDTFRDCLERMYDHGEKTVRSYFEQIPDGRYTASGEFDDDGVVDEPIPYSIAVEVEGSDVRLDYTDCTDERTGPLNCPHPNTVSASRVAISMLAGGSEAPCEGFFRPIEVKTRAGSMFHPLPPAPAFLFLWPAMQAIEVIYRAIGEALPDSVPAASGGDLCALIWWGTRKATGEPWADGCPHPIGQGAGAHTDGETDIHVCEAATRFPPVEVWEAKNPWVVEKMELAPDSCGAGKYRGGLGVDYVFRMREDSFVTVTLERCNNAPWGIAGGSEGRPNACFFRDNTGQLSPIGKATGLKVETGCAIELHTGGGGGHGPASNRDQQSVITDFVDGYVTRKFVERNYPHVELARAGLSRR